MSARLDEWGLDRNPHELPRTQGRMRQEHISWYYEEPRGLNVYSKGVWMGFIPISSIRAYIKRLDARR